jgi:hypothetical protein
MYAVTIVPFSSKGDSKELKQRTRQWERDAQPRTAEERDLVRQAARLSLSLERGELVETRMLDSLASTQVRELSRRLL